MTRTKPPPAPAQPRMLTPRILRRLPFVFKARVSGPGFVFVQAFNAEWGITRIVELTGQNLRRVSGEFFVIDRDPSQGVERWDSRKRWKEFVDAYNAAHA